MLLNLFYIYKYILVIFLFTTICSFGQSNKGKILIGGNINLSNKRIETKNYAQELLEKEFIFRFSPRLGYFLTDKFCLGLKTPLIYQHGYFEIIDTTGVFSTYNSYEYYLSPFLRYYFINKKIAIISDISYSYGNTHYKYKMLNKNNSTEIGSHKIIEPKHNLGFGCGLGYYISNNVCIEGIFIFNIRTHKIKMDDEQRDQEKMIQELLFEFGIHYLINTKISINEKND